MADEILVQNLDVHRRETRENFNRIEVAIGKLADSMVTMTTALTRVEERHQKHDEGIARIHHRHDLLQERVRKVEDELLIHRSTSRVSLKALSIVGTVAGMVITVGVTLVGYFV